MQYKEHILNPEFTKHAFWLDNFHFCIHEFKDAKDKEFHDHPHGFYTGVIEGWYAEEIMNLNGEIETIIRSKGDFRWVDANTIHRIAESTRDCKTIVIPNKNVQEWGFIEKRPDGLYKRFWNEQEFKLING